MNVLVVNDISWDNFAIVARRLNTRCINPNHRINYFYGKDMKYISNICNQNLFTLIRRPLVQENLKDLILDSLKYTKFCIIFHNFIEYNTISGFILQLCQEHEIPYFVFSEHCDNFYFNGDYISDTKFKTIVRNITFIQKSIDFLIPEYLILDYKKTCPKNIEEVVNNLRTRYQCIKDEKNSKKIIKIEDAIRERRKIDKSDKEIKYLDFMTNKQKWLKETMKKN